MKNVFAGMLALLAVVAGLSWLCSEAEKTLPETGESAAASSSSMEPVLGKDGVAPRDLTRTEATTPPAWLEVQVRWKHSGAVAQQGDVSLTPTTGQEDPRHATVNEGQAILECPASWTSVRLEVRHPGAAPVSERLSLPHSGPRTVHLEATHAVAGEITTSGTGEPIADAHVGFQGVPGSWRTTFDETRSDRRGEYELLLPGSGTQRILFVAAGHADRMADVEVTQPGITELDVELESAFELRVQVLDESRAPLEGVRVTPSLYSHWGNYDYRNSVFTDREGKAIVPRLNRRAPQPIVFMVEGFKHYTLKLDAPPATGETMERTVILEKEQGSPRRIEGFVRDEQGVALEGIHVRCRYSANVSFRPDGIKNPGVVTATDGKGYYRLELHDEDDECVIAAGGEGWSPVIRTGVRSGPPEEPGRLDLTLNPAHWLEGQVVDEDGNPIPEVEIVVMPGPQIFNALVYPEAASRTRTDEDGHFSMTGLPLPPIRVELKPPRGSEWSSWDAPPDLSTNQQVEFVLRSIGEIRGSVVAENTGSAIRAFSVQMKSATGGFWEHKKSRFFRTSDGRFALPGIDRSREWALRIHAEGYLTREIRPIQVFRSGERGELVVELEVPTRFRGRVVSSEDGAAVPGVTVRFGVWPYSGPVYWGQFGKSMLHYQEVTTDQHGDFELIDSPEGSLFIRHEGFRRVVLSAEDRRRLVRSVTMATIELEAAESITGIYRPERGTVKKNVGVGLLKLTSEVDEHGYPQAVGYGFTRTDENGRFGWSDLDPGRYLLEVHRRDLRPFQLIYRRRIELAPGDHLELEVGPDLGPHSFRGRLLRPDGRPQDRVMLILRPRFDWDLLEISCHVGAYHDGRFHLPGLKAGVYQVEVRSWDHGRYPLPDLEISRDLERDLDVEIP